MSTRPKRGRLISRRNLALVAFSAANRCTIPDQARDRLSPENALCGARGHQGRARVRAHRLGPGDDLEPAVEVLHERGAAFDPVAAIEIAHAELVVDRRMMDVAADDAVDMEAPGFRRERLFEIADVI